MGFGTVYLGTDLMGYYEKFGLSLLDRAWLANGEEVKVYQRPTIIGSRNLL